MVDRGTFTNIANDLSFVDEVVRSHAPHGSMTPLPVGWIPDNSSVICGRGQDAYNHIGNRRFRVLVEAHVHVYNLASSRFEKSVVVMKIVDTVRECSGIGGFVRKDIITGRWFEVGDVIAREKAGQQFRSTIASTDPTKYQRKPRRKLVKNKKSVGKLQEEKEGSSDEANNEQSSGSTGAAKIFGGATSSKYAWTEDRLVRGSQYLLGVPFQRRSFAPLSNGVRLDRKASWERFNAVVEGKSEGVFGRFMQPADPVFPSSYRATSSEDDDISLNEKEMILHQHGRKSSQEERMNARIPSSLSNSKNDPMRQLMDLERLNTSCPSLGTDPKDYALVGITCSSIYKQPNLLEHPYNYCVHREARKGDISADTATSTKPCRCEEVLSNSVFQDPPNFDIDNTFTFL